MTTPSLSSSPATETAAATAAKTATTTTTGSESATGSETTGRSGSEATTGPETTTRSGSETTTGPATEPMTIVVRYFASARAAAGAEEEKLELPNGATVADAVAALRALHPGQLPRVLDAASFLVNEIAVRDRARALSDGARLDVLPPFAGG